MYQARAVLAFWGAVFRGMARLVQKRQSRPL